MIQASELRIGNWLEPTRAGFGEKYIKVESVAFDRVNIDFREYRIDEMRPVPITADLLDGFVDFDWPGFQDFKHLTDGRVILRLHDEGASVFMNDECNWKDYRFIAKVKYMHQLQNLYYALTGEEMEVGL